VVLTIVIATAVAIWLTRLTVEERITRACLALILGGAIGNLIDRVVFGHVVDFIQVYLPFIPLALFNPWPSFNIADSAISIGVAVLLVETFRTERRRQPADG
jgi:signal peptidase II